jgi:hypothetical protein
MFLWSLKGIRASTLLWLRSCNMVITHVDCRTIRRGTVMWGLLSW